MKVKSKNNFGLKGFTLIEIIVVLIILGVLAAVALPSLFDHIKRAKSAEALIALGSYKNQIEACVQANPGQEFQCRSLEVNFAPTANFVYKLGSLELNNCSVVFQNGLTNGNPNWKLTACSPSLGGLIEMTRTGENITCAGVLVFSGIC